MEGLAIDAERVRPEIALYRCPCAHCDQAQRLLAAMAARHGAPLVVRSVLVEGQEGWARWLAPLVYVNGIEASRFALRPRRWLRLLRKQLLRRTLRGTIVDYGRALHRRPPGPGGVRPRELLLGSAPGTGREEEDRARADEIAVFDAGLPMGLLSEDGRLYRLTSPLARPQAFETLRALAGRRVLVRGDAFRWRGRDALVVLDQEELPNAKPAIIKGARSEPAPSSVGSAR